MVSSSQPRGRGTSEEPRARSSTFGPLLKRWRSERHFTQERLALEAEVSTRHLSFLEGGKAAPSREMVLVLATTLDLPLRDRNVLLGAAGFQPAYGTGGLDDDALATVRRALDLILAKHEPYGAVVFDRLGGVLRMNGGAQRLMGHYLDASVLEPRILANAHLAIFHPHGLRPWIVNWDEVGSLLVERLHREIALHPDDDARRALLDEILRFPGLPARFSTSRAAQKADPIVPVHLRKGGRDVRLLTTLTTLGTPLDVTAQEVTIESYYPADDATEAFMHALAEGATA